MNKHLSGFLVVVCILTTFALAYRHAFGLQRPPSPPASATAAAVAAANSFLGSLGSDLRAKAQLDLRPEVRRRWSNLPTGVVMQVDQGRPGGPFERNGVKLGALSKAQQDAALALVAATLSPAGYRKVIDIVDADEMLEKTSAPSRPATTAVRFGRAEYYVAVLGTPSAAGPWMVQFGGHHLAVNITIAGADSVLTPSHTGAQPTTFVQNGRTVRPLGDELDKALALFASLTPAQQKEAILGYKVADVVAGPGLDGK